MTPPAYDPHDLTARAYDLADRFHALGRVVGAVSGHLSGHDRGVDIAAVTAVGHLVNRAAARLRLWGDHTVVALAGATGGGKSSLFNALARMEVSPVGDLRPTTGEAYACVWGPRPPDALLDWLGIDRRQRLVRESVLDADREAPLRGLVLLDLPDMDTVAHGHRLEADRLLGVVDLVVWVLDPQKYADQAVHDGHLRHLGVLRDVTVVVFNQVDRLTPADAARCRADLARLVEADGLTGVPVLATSAATGEGVDDLRALLERTVAGRYPALARLEAEFLWALGVVAPLVGPDVGQDAVSRDMVVELADRLAVAAGVTAVAADAERAYARRAAVPGWMARGTEKPQHIPSADRVAVAVAVRRVAARVGAGLPTPWPDELRRAVTTNLDWLPEVLSGALAGAWPRSPGALGWRLARLVWWLAVLAAGAGAGWLGWYVAARADGPTPGLPGVGGVAVPLLMFGGGGAVSLLLILISRPLGAARARRHRARVDRRLREATAAVARDVLRPVRAVLSDYVDAYAAYRLAAPPSEEDHLGAEWNQEDPVLSWPR